jgi:hypothetical protein
MQNAHNDRFIVHERDPILEAGFEPDTPDEAYAARARARQQAGRENFFANTSLEEAEIVLSGPSMMRCRSEIAALAYHTGPSFEELRKIIQAQREERLRILELEIELDGYYDRMMEAQRRIPGL